MLCGMEQHLHSPLFSQVSQLNYQRVVYDCTAGDRGGGEGEGRYGVVGD